MIKISAQLKNKIVLCCLIVTDTSPHCVPFLWLWVMFKMTENTTTPPLYNIYIYVAAENVEILSCYHSGWCGGNEENKSINQRIDERNTCTRIFLHHKYSYTDTFYCDGRTVTRNRQSIKTMFNLSHKGDSAAYDEIQCLGFSNGAGLVVPVQRQNGAGGE